MHEASLVQGLLNVAFRAVEEHNAQVDARRAAGDAGAGRKAVRITRLTCSLGLLSCVEPQTLTACFELLAEGTMAEGARLLLNMEPLPCRCEECGAAFELGERRFVCPACGSHSLRFRGGHGMTMTGLDVTAEDEADTPTAANEDKHD
ncbi:hydrogenase maturation nickel metallochaperone HypA [Desulfovibrio sp.]|uniref:hydrogenase maturation nickel metallochaperone HypA/HybF n=1 Tax=Desulfovibrio sp. TaxID=885 RepID=UPI0025C1D504|nr:hydrogenase maturation nickel metallochaperone HypA [Desulfovibrio sp.]MCI7569385.1 hydrogenase maturation nickel metallochaperone HypA [Desulfovibrio sp.]